MSANNANCFWFTGCMLTWREHPYQSVRFSTVRTFRVFRTVMSSDMIRNARRVLSREIISNIKIIEKIILNIVSSHGSILSNCFDWFLTFILRQYRGVLSFKFPSLETVETKCWNRMVEKIEASNWFSNYFIDHWVLKYSHWMPSRNSLVFSPSLFIFCASKFIGDTANPTDMYPNILAEEASCRTKSVEQKTPPVVCSYSFQTKSIRSIVEFGLT